eukprot:973112-Pleurochrysis_carterae.AAC.5
MSSREPATDAQRRLRVPSTKPSHSFGGRHAGFVATTWHGCTRACETGAWPDPNGALTVKLFLRAQVRERNLSVCMRASTISPCEKSACHGS